VPGWGDGIGISPAEGLVRLVATCRVSERKTRKMISIFRSDTQFTPSFYERKAQAIA
jgi:hypothetical protein